MRLLAKIQLSFFVFSVGILILTLFFDSRWYTNHAQLLAAEHGQIVDGRDNTPHAVHVSSELTSIVASFAQRPPMLFLSCAKPQTAQSEEEQTATVESGRLAARRLRSIHAYPHVVLCADDVQREIAASPAVLGGDAHIGRYDLASAGAHGAVRWAANRLTDSYDTPLVDLDLVVECPVANASECVWFVRWQAIAGRGWDAVDETLTCTEADDGVVAWHRGDGGRPQQWTCRHADDGQLPLVKRSPFVPDPLLPKVGEAWEDTVVTLPPHLSHLADGGSPLACPYCTAVPRTDARASSFTDVTGHVEHGPLGGLQVRTAVHTAQTTAAAPIRAVPAGIIRALEPLPNPRMERRVCCVACGLAVRRWASGNRVPLSPYEYPLLQPGDAEIPLFVSDIAREWQEEGRDLLDELAFLRACHFHLIDGSTENLPRATSLSLLAGAVPLVLDSTPTVLATLSWPHSVVALSASTNLSLVETLRGGDAEALAALRSWHQRWRRVETTSPPLLTFGYSPARFVCHLCRFARRPPHRLGVIVPFRDGGSGSFTAMLHTFLPSMRSYLDHAGLPSTIVIVNQTDSLAFNRAKLFNVGALSLPADEGYDYFCFLDVEYIPVNEADSYRHPGSTPVHPSSSYSCRDKSTFLTGGTFCTSREQFQAAHGWPNECWGWGGEDFNMETRFQKGLNKPIFDPTPELGYHTCFSNPEVIHDERKMANNTANIQSGKRLQRSWPPEPRDRLSSTKFTEVGRHVDAAYGVLYLQVNL